MSFNLQLLLDIYLYIYDLNYIMINITINKKGTK
jgi:hypothetical protein